MNTSNTPPGGTPGPEGQDPGQGRPPVQTVGVMTPPPPPAYLPPVYAPPPPRRGGVLMRVVGGLVSSLLILSVLLNFYFGAYFWAATLGGPREHQIEAGSKAHRIVILPVEGLVSDTMEAFVRQSLRALNDSAPAAIVLRVDSPGGDPFACDRIVHLVEKFRADRPGVPIIASYGTVAASGGYYISAGCDKIFAEPLTRTGSIGVISMSFTFKGLLDKVGVASNVQTATGSPLKDVANNPFRDFNDADRQEIQQSIDQLHQRFVEVVHRGRSSHLKLEQVQQLANGKVYTTAEAVEARLVDQEGFLDDAIEHARQAANIPANVKPQVTVMQLPPRLTLSGLLTGGRSSALKIEPEQVRQWLIELETPRAEYRYLPRW